MLYEPRVAHGITVHATGGSTELDVHHSDELDDDSRRGPHRGPKTPMIECKDILDLCHRFAAYLTPLDIHVLRRRYNGNVMLSIYALGREMGISDETVRTIENRALDALDHCLTLEAYGQPITPDAPGQVVSPARRQPDLRREVAIGVVRARHRAPWRLDHRRPTQ